MVGVPAEVMKLVAAWEHVEATDGLAEVRERRPTPTRFSRHGRKRAALGCPFQQEDIDDSLWPCDKSSKLQGIKRSRMRSCWWRTCCYSPESSSNTGRRCRQQRSHPVSLLFDRRRVSWYIGTSQQVLANWRSNRRGPEFVSDGEKFVRYKVGSLRAFMADRVKTTAGL
jgi:hypothetical protein